MPRARRPIRDRFFEKTVATPNGCLIWLGARNTDGYGRFNVEGQIRGAHIVAWFLAYGSWPETGLQVLHQCDNPPCVSAEHLFLGTHADNMRDAKNKGRTASQRKIHCVNGHPLSGPNLRVRQTDTGTYRICRICSRATDLKHHPRVGVPPGGKPRLTDLDVHAIRARYPKVSVIQLATEYGVTVGTIRNIVTRRTWRNL